MKPIYVLCVWMCKAFSNLRKGGGDLSSQNRPPPQTFHSGPHGRHKTSIAVVSIAHNIPCACAECVWVVVVCDRWAGTSDGAKAATDTADLKRVGHPLQVTSVTAQPEHVRHMHIRGNLERPVQLIRVSMEHRRRADGGNPSQCG